MRRADGSGFSQHNLFFTVREKKVASFGRRIRVAVYWAVLNGER